MEKYGSQRAAARELGLSMAVVNKWFRRAHPAAPASPSIITKTTTLRGPEGETRMQWVHEQTEVEQDREERWRAFAEEMSRGVAKVRPTDVPKVKNDNSDLLALYPVGDHHMGMLSWHEETGADYDLQIGTRLLNGAFAHLTSLAKTADTALIVFMGDFMHYDSFETVTPASRHMLDSDSRYSKVARAAVQLMRGSVDAALRAHREVVVIVKAGNHDPSSSVFLEMCLAVAYENEPRVTVLTSPAACSYYRFGKVLLGFHHGHSIKMDKLPLIMAADKPDDWAASQCRAWWTGHIHTSKTQAAICAQDYSGVTVESVRILPPPDAWAAGQGYRPIRGMDVVLYHKAGRRVGRFTFEPDMLDDTEE